MDVSAYTEDIKLRQWADMVRDCKASGLTVRAWCKEQGLNKKTYYYRRKQVMRALEQMEPGNLSRPVRFTELQMTKEPDRPETAAVIECGNVRVAITNRAQMSLLQSLLAALKESC